MSEVTLGGPGHGARVLGDLVGGTLVRDAALVAGGAVLVGAAAQLSIPVPGSPVPITGQTFAVLLAGSALGLWRGAASMLLYLVVGVLGVPWFAGGASGVPSATFGYLVGFVVAAGLAGRLAAAGGDRKAWRTALTMAAGTAVIYLFGVPWLAIAVGVDLPEAARLGLVPYLAGDAIKAVIAAGLLPGAWRIVNLITGERDQRR